MKTLRFTNGDEMPVLGLGTWQAAPGEVQKAVKEAIRLGYRHLDCASIYGNETEIGEALSECFDEGLLTREELWVTSKLWSDSRATPDVIPALEKTLSDLCLDFIDLYLIHWPVVLKKGVPFPESGDDLIALDDLPVRETWHGLEDAHRKGLCRHLGVSNFSLHKLKHLLAGAQIKPEVNQVEMHPYLQQPKLLEFCAKQGVFLTAYSPLGSNGRPDGFKHPEEPVLLEDPVIREIAEERDMTPAQVLLQWALRRGTSVIPKSSNPKRLEQNLAAANVELQDEDLARIAGLDRHRRYIDGSFWFLKGGPYSAENLWDE